MIDMNIMTSFNVLSIQYIAIENISQCPCAFLPWGHWMNEMTKLTKAPDSQQYNSYSFVGALHTDCWVTHHFEGNWLLKQFVRTMLPQFTETGKRLTFTVCLTCFISDCSGADCFLNQYSFYFSYLLAMSFNAPEWMRLYSYQNKAPREEVYT